ncbi:MAG: hypothetical protein WCN87_04340 [Chlamydiota bacterium]|jgi:hypothetical protein
MKHFVQRSCYRTFDLKFINPNMFFLRSLRDKDLGALKSGELIKKREYSLFAKWRLEALLNTLFYAFLYDIRSPLDLVGMERYFLHKKKFAEKALQNLQSYTYIDTSHLEELFQQFKKRYILRRMIVERAGKSPSKTGLIHELEEALKKGVTPQPILKGCSGTWFLRDKNYTKRAIFKPFDEEMGAPHNPRGDSLRGILGSASIRKGIRSGESYLREAAVYKMSRYLGFSVVPETTVAAFSNNHFLGVRHYFIKPGTSSPQKLGSLQVFIPNAQDFNAFSPRFIESIAPELLQPIFLLDIIVGHDDRHAHNLLWDGYKVFAIDNGFALSSVEVSRDSWKWLDMVQAKAPLAPLLKVKILALKAEELPLDFDEAVYARVKERLALLQVGLEEGLTLFDIGSAMTPSGMQSLLNLDKTLYERARKVIQERKSTMERENFWPTF